VAVDGFALLVRLDLGEGVAFAFSSFFTEICAAMPPIAWMLRR
jgi:hypothetical protein